jgi:hypothetical protein
MINNVDSPGLSGLGRIDMGDQSSNFKHTIPYRDLLYAVALLPKPALD